ncbi:hypothetical protein ACOSQ4_021441 [Xanthoceras sorbifolium]
MASSHSHADLNIGGPNYTQDQSKMRRNAQHIQPNCVYLLANFRQPLSALPPPRLSAGMITHLSTSQQGGLTVSFQLQARVPELVVQEGDHDNRCRNYNCNTNDTPMWRRQTRNVSDTEKVAKIHELHKQQVAASAVLLHKPSARSTLDFTRAEASTSAVPMPSTLTMLAVQARAQLTWHQVAKIHELHDRATAGSASLLHKQQVAESAVLHHKPSTISTLDFTRAEASTPVVPMPSTLTILVVQARGKSLINGCANDMRFTIG